MKTICGTDLISKNFQIFNLNSLTIFHRTTSSQEDGSVVGIEDATKYSNERRL